MIKILLVEDNVKICENIIEYLNKDMQIEAVHNGNEAIDYLNFYHGI
ncbi:MAG: hypothetical protein ACRC57_04110 [Sarcina sp.]